MIFYYDTTHGKLIAKLLQGVGLTVRTYKNMGWCGDKPDIEWIAECGRNDWAIISGDKAISRVPEERQAVINAKCKVFMLDDGHVTRTEDWAAALLVGREEIIRFATTANGPFFVTVKPCHVRGHITKPDFIIAAGGGWKQIEAPSPDPSPVIITAAAPAAAVSRRPQQRVMFPELVSQQMSVLDCTHCDACAQFSERVTTLTTRALAPYNSNHS